MLDLDAQRRAYELLQWVPYSLPTEFNEDLAADGYYTRLQRQRSNAALDAFDKQHPAERSTELEAFHELKRLGIYTNADFFSPSKAKDGYYAKRLKEHLSINENFGSFHGAVSALDGYSIYAALPLRNRCASSCRVPSETKKGGP